jgi:hypothetical protein
VFYAGGGGGGVNSIYLLNGLGSAGGGNGGLATSNILATSATANTGSGGGAGAAQTGTYAFAGNGGSGIVIIRYPATQSAPTSTTGNPQINYADGYQIYTWTSSGTITF